MSLRGRGYPADRRWRACRSRGTSKEEWGSRRPVRHLRERQSRSNDGVIGVIAAGGRLRRRLAQVQEGLRSVPVGCISKARALSSRSLRRSSEPRQAIKGTQHGQPQRRSQRHARRTRPRLPATSVSSGLRTSTTKNDRYPTRPRGAAADGAVQVTVPGNNAGKTTPLLARASSDGARCATLAAGYHNHRWKD